MSGNLPAFPKERVLKAFEKFFQQQGGHVGPDQLVKLMRVLHAGWPDDRITALVANLPTEQGGLISCKTFVDWLYSASGGGDATCGPPAPAVPSPEGQAQPPIPKNREPAPAASPEVGETKGGQPALSSWLSSASPVGASFELQLRQLLKEHPYLEPDCSVHPHPLQLWVQLCRQCVQGEKFVQAQDHLRRVRTSLETDKRQISEAFRRFDMDKDGYLDAEEFQHLCAYLGWSVDECSLMKFDQNGKVNLADFQLFIGRMGGVQHFFEHRRLRISASRKDVCDYSGIAVGARVRAHFYVRGQKSRSWREAVVTAVGVERKEHVHGPSTYGVQLEFGFGAGQRWRARQVVPPTWVLSGIEDASVAAAMREVGLLSEHHAFWELLLPQSEMQAVERLEPCQRAALATVRTQSAQNHADALPKVRQKMQSLGFGEKELQAVLGWVQDLAPVVIHVHLDRMGQFMEVDEFYRNQFETKTSCGALDPENRTRTGWEHELFGGCYDDCKPFERCKYGALNVMNDYRGVVRARGYGDSYLVLKDVRLRCTFASTDSGGIAGSRLAVLDHYAHVLSEFSDEELRGLVAVAVANITGGEPGDPSSCDRSCLKLLRGVSEDPAMEWVTFGFPALAQSHGRYLFEVVLMKDCCTPQVGVLSSDFEARPFVASAQGVGDDEHGWAADGQNAALWHGGLVRAWSTLWPHETRPALSGTKYLSQEVVVGVCVDITERKLWFSTDGVWAEEPAFEGQDFPAGVALYPAISLKGAAAFNFGPGWRHPPPEEHTLRPFERWPGAPTGSLMRLDDPRLGNEEKLSMYKEVQIHGEVSLKRNVQRLVACNKYKTTPKVGRPWALGVTNAGNCNGSYKRVGAHQGMPLYRSTSSSSSIIYCDREARAWRINDKEDMNSWLFSAPASGSQVEEPPRSGWRPPELKCGVLPQEHFQQALEDLGLAAEHTQRLLSVLSACDSSGRQVVCRRRGDNTLVQEWARLPEPPCTCEEAWAAGVVLMQKELLHSRGLEAGVVIESSHPYEAKRHEWKREVRMEGAEGLYVNFASRSCTLDRRTRLRVFTGGLSREAAGLGSRVQVPLVGGDKVWGTVLERGTGGSSWRVKLDRHKLGEQPGATAGWPAVGDLVEGKYKSGAWHKATVVEVKTDGIYVLDWYDGLTRDREKPQSKLRRPAEQAPNHRHVEDVARYAPIVADCKDCFALCMEEPSKASVHYESTDEVSKVVGDEISGFSLHRNYPLSPFRVRGLKGDGPARQSGVREGWFLDLAATLSGPSGTQFLSLFEGLGDVSAKEESEGTLLDVGFANIEELHKRLNDELLRMTDVRLAFTNSCSPTQVVLLPEAHVTYEHESVGSEIRAFLGGKTIRIKGFVSHGPAHAAGVRTDWQLDLDTTLNHNPGRRPPVEQEAIIANPNVLLNLSGVTLVFTQPHPEPTQQFEASGDAGAKAWEPRMLPGDFAEFVFSTDGDGGSQPDRRWGVWALVQPKGSKDAWAHLRTAAQAEAKEEMGRRRETRVAEAEEARKVKAAEEAADARMQGWVYHQTAAQEEAGSEEMKAARAAKEAALAEKKAKEDSAKALREGEEEETSLWKDSLGKAISQEVDRFAAAWHEATQSAYGPSEWPEVQRGGWDEARLRALCARHGWEFEWMTEEGERRRRGRERWDPKALRMQECVARPFEADTMIPDGSTPVESGG